MRRTALERWLAERTPPVPPGFVPYLMAGVSQEEPDPQGLEGLGCAAIREAVIRPGRNRDVAFRLLAGDAYLTYACEAVAERGEDVERALDHLIQRVGARLS